MNENINTDILGEDNPFERRYKKARAQLENVREELERSLREKVKLQEELEQLNDSYKEKEHELSLKSETLSFVQEIFSAEPIEDSDISHLNNLVERIASLIKEDIKDNFKEFLRNKGIPTEVLEELFEKNLTKWCVTTQKKWIQGKTAIAFVGEFSAGKTSIVNRILSQDKEEVMRLPVSTKATTAIPTYILGGDKAVYNFVTPDNIIKSISPQTFKRINKEVLDQVSGLSALIQYFIMRYENPILNDLSILDTPGFNSNDKEDALRTLNVINECDALFWVIDVNVGTVNKSSIEIIKKHLTKPLYIIINKVDTKHESEIIKVEELIQKTLDNEGVSVKEIIRFSQTVPLSTLMSKITNIPVEDKNDYLKGLFEILDKCISIVKDDFGKIEKDITHKDKECKELNNQYIKTINSLYHKCLDIESKPHLEKHLFRDEVYEMSMHQYNDLKEQLNEMIDLCGKDLVLLNNIQNEAHLALSELCEKKRSIQYTYRCMESSRKQLKKLVEQLNNI